MRDSLLNDIDIPHEAALCHDKMCSIHKQDICAYHDAITMAMIQACSETITTSKSGCSNVKDVPGWNEYIEGYFRISLFWHSLWIDNGKPRHGIVADLRCKTRAQYHRVCKIVLRKDAEIRCDTMADAIISNPSGNSLYQQANVFCHKKMYYPNKVDNAQGQSEISNFFAEKYQNLYNSVSYI